MKTILIPIFQGAEAKNILRTNVYKELIADPDVRLVLIVGSEAKRQYYQKEFSHPRVVYELFHEYQSSRLDHFFGALKFLTLNTKTTRLRRSFVYEETKNSFVYRWQQLASFILAHRIVRQFFRFFDYHLVRSHHFLHYFTKYQPDVVFVAHLFSDVEIALVREAKQRGIPVIGFVNSWDKVTARCTVRILPDTLIVFNDIVKAEALLHVDMKAQDIVVSGLPQYDHYVEYQPISRTDFFRKKQLDPNKKLLVYAPVGRFFSYSDWEIIDFLHTHIENGDIRDAQLLVRFQPNDFFDQSELDKRPHLRYDYPGIRFSKDRGVDWDMNQADLDNLVDTLVHLSVLVCYFSSISIDAAVFDKPVINVGFEITPQTLPTKTPSRQYPMEHYSKALATGAIRLVKDQSELLDSINEYLLHPEQQKAERQRLVQEQCGELDAKAGQRIAHVLLKTLI